jgi:hypothetical protein
MSERDLPDPLASLSQIRDMLTVQPDFRIVPARQIPDSMPGLSFLGCSMGLAVGWAIKEGRLTRFGAAFSGGLTLLHFRISQAGPRTLAMDIHWHFAARRSGQAVFIHFLDRDGELRFQGDYSLDGETPDPLGFAYSRRSVTIPEGVAAGTYRVRLGVWLPNEGRHVTLGRTRGCVREHAGAYGDSVLLDAFTV